MSDHTTPERQTTVRVTYFDTAMALIEVAGLRLLTDPVLDAAGTYMSGPVRLDKTGGPAVTREQLGRIDAVLLSHDQHADNLDPAGRAFLATLPHVLTTPDGAARLAAELPGVTVEGLAPWATATITGADGVTVTVTGTPARHGPAGTEAMTGPVTGFLLSWPGVDGYAVYVSGDTVPFEGTEEIARRAAPVGVALLNLGRVQLTPEPGPNFSMTAEEAGALGAALQARHVVPLHVEGWAHFSEGRDAAAAMLTRTAVAERVSWLRSGEPQEFSV